MDARTSSAAARMASKRSATGISPGGHAQAGEGEGVGARRLRAGADRHRGPQAVDRRAELAVVGAGRRRGRREEGDVERAARACWPPPSPRRAAPGGPRGGAAGSGWSRGSSGPARCRRASPTVERTDLPSDVPISASRAGSSMQAGSSLRLRSADTLQPVADRLPGEVAPGSGPARAPRRRAPRRSAAAARARRARGRGTASRSSGRSSPSVTVWCIFWMNAALAALHAVDDVELPQRPGAVERVGQHGGGQVEQLAQRPGGGQSDVADVVVEVDVGDVDPRPAAGRTGRSWTRWRRRGTSATARASRRRRRSTSAGRSSRVTLAKFELKAGSTSRRHIRPSASVMRRSSAAGASDMPGRLEPQGRERASPSAAVLSEGCWCA